MARLFLLFHLNFEALEQEIPPEPELAVDTDTLATIERNEEEGNNEKEETNEPHSPEMMDNLNVTVDNFDELTFEQEEKAYFDHKEDQELLVNYEPPMNERNQEALTIKNLEGEDTFFDAWQERSIDEQGEVW